MAIKTLLFTTVLLTWEAPLRENGAIMIDKAATPPINEVLKYEIQYDCSVKKGSKFPKGNTLGYTLSVPYPYICRARIRTWDTQGLISMWGEWVYFTTKPKVITL